MEEMRQKIESFFVKYGIASRSNIDYDGFMRPVVQNPHKFDIQTEEGRHNLLHRFVTLYANGLYIDDYNKYFSNVLLPENLEGQLKKAMSLITLRFKMKNRYPGLYIDNKENIDILSEFCELLCFISESWTLKRAFSNEQDLSKMAKWSICDVFTKYAYSLKVAIHKELPELIMENANLYTY